MNKTTTRQRVRRSLLWTSTSKLGSQLLLFFTMAVMARLLDFAQIGLMSLCLIYMQFLNNFIDAGFQHAVIQTNHIDQETLDSCFVFLLGLVVIAYIATWAIAPVFANYFNERTLIRLIRVIGLVLFFVPFQVLPVAILTRDLQVDMVGKIELLAGIIRASMSISLALLGFGVWSLIYGYIAARITIAILTLYLSKWRPTIYFDFYKVKSILDFGIKIIISRIIWFLQNRIDLIITASVLGVESLGLYTIARQIFDQLYIFFSISYNRILFPLFSQLNNRQDDLRPMFLLVVKVSSVIVFPLLFFISSTADYIIHLVFGPKWAGAAIILILLGYIGGFRIINVISATAINAVGRPEITIWFNILELTFLSISFYFGASYYNLLGISFAWLVYIFIYFIVQYISMLILAIPFVEYLKKILIPFLFAVVLGILLNFVNCCFIFPQPLLQLIVLFIISSILYGVSLMTIFKNETLYVYKMLT